MLKANGISFCSCCGTTVAKDEELVRISLTSDSKTLSRFVSRSHLVSWASLAGEGEKLALNTKGKFSLDDLAPAPKEVQVR